MLLAEISTVDALYLVKWVLGCVLGACAVVLAVACVLDVRERRRWRAMVPDAWPPPGMLHDEAGATPRKEVTS